jgi:hypothetical protein
MLHVLVDAYLLLVFLLALRWPWLLHAVLCCHLHLGLITTVPAAAAAYAAAAYASAAAAAA